MKPLDLSSTNWFGRFPFGAVVGGLASPLCQLHREPVTNLYAIVAGEHIACTGIAGEPLSLPSEDQTGVEQVAGTASAESLVGPQGMGDGPLMA